MMSKAHGKLDLTYLPLPGLHCVPMANQTRLTVILVDDNELTRAAPRLVIARDQYAMAPEAAIDCILSLQVPGRLRKAAALRRKALG